MVYRRIKYILAPKFDADVYFSPKLQTWRLMCTQSPNLEAKVNFACDSGKGLGYVWVRFGLGYVWDRLCLG